MNSESVIATQMKIRKKTFEKTLNSHSNIEQRIHRLLLCNRIHILYMDLYKGHRKMDVEDDSFTRRETYCGTNNPSSNKNQKHHHVFLNRYQKRAKSNSAFWMILYVVIPCILLSSLTEHALARVIQTSTCKSWVDGRIINLEPLKRTDGKPRFTVSHGSVNFTFNPCASFNMPLDPHSGAGDQCYYVSLCKSVTTLDSEEPKFYTIGIQSSIHVFHKEVGQSNLPVNVKKLLDNSEESELQEDSAYNITYEERDEDVNGGPGVEVMDDSDEDSSDESDDETERHKLSQKLDEIEDSTAGYVNIRGYQSDESSYSSSEEFKIIFMTYRGVRSMKKSKTFIYLFCDHNRVSVDDALFEYVHVPKSQHYHFQLRHQCACPDGCPEFGEYGGNGVQNKNGPEELDMGRLKHMWIILIINGGIIAFAIVIGAVFCRQGGGNGAYYNMLPALHSSHLTMNSSESLFVSKSKFHKPEYLEYTSALTKAAEPPVIDGGIIYSRDLDVGQRLGGGLFGDTYVADFHERKVAAKRINVGVHQNQLTLDDLDWIQKEVNLLRKQHHKNLITVMGLCRDSPQPYVITEFLKGDILKDLLRRHEAVSWSKRIKIALQICDAMAYLHSAYPPILHRDLRCSNVMLDEEERVKVCDFGLTRIMQKLRHKCTGRRGCYCRKDMSAVPSSVRWTAPEILNHPTADESHNANVLTSRCDVYSMAMVMWELATGLDPFEDIPDEDEVIEIVKGGGRPPLDSVPDVLPFYSDLTKKCWSQLPDNRPNFKAISASLKRTLQSVTKAGAANKRNRTTSTTSYITSLLNIHGNNE